MTLHFREDRRQTYRPTARMCLDTILMVSYLAISLDDSSQRLVGIIGTWVARRLFDSFLTDWL